MLDLKILDKRTTLLPSPPRRTVLSEVIDNAYTKDVLVRLYAEVLHPFFAARFGADAPQASLRSNARKAVYVEVLLDLYTNQALFRKLVASLPRAVQRTFEILTWYGPRTIGKLEHELGVVILSSEGRRDHYSWYYQPPQPPASYAFFPMQRAYYGAPHHTTIGLPPELQAQFQHLLPPPEAATLTPAEPPDEAQRYRAEATILADLRRYDLFVRDGHIDYGKTGQPLKKSIRRMATYCEVPEFFDDRTGPRSLLATSLLVDLLTAYAPAEPPDDEMALLETLLTGYFTDQEVSLSDLFLSHLKGRNQTYNAYRDRQVRLTLLALLTDLPPHAWIDVDALQAYATTTNQLMQLYTEGEANRMRIDVVQQTYARSTEEGWHFYYRNENLYPDYYDAAITRPLLQGHLALMAVLGLVDLAYTDPTNDILRNASYDFLTPFDGVAAVRLTSLGAYLTGQIPHYEAPASADRPEVTVTLDDRYLIFMLSGEDKIKMMIADQLAEAIGPLRYRITYTSFLRGCATRHDVDEQIRRFHAHLAAEVPPHFDAFFTEVRRKIAPLRLERRKLVFRLDGGPELVTLMATDEVLRQYILKAEDHHIIVDEPNVARVQRRLEAFGYLMERP